MSKNDDALKTAYALRGVLCYSPEVVKKAAQHIERLVAENEALQHYSKVYGQVSEVLACTAEMPPLSDDDEITVQRLKMLVESHNTYVDSCEAKADRIDRLGEAIVKLRAENEAQAALLRQAVEALDDLSTYQSRPSSIWRYFYPSTTGDYVNLREVKEKVDPAIAAIRQHLEGRA